MKNITLVWVTILFFIAVYVRSFSWFPSSAFKFARSSQNARAMSHSSTAQSMSGFSVQSMPRMDDEEEEEGDESDDDDEGESSDAASAPMVELGSDSPQISLLKEGIKFPTSLNGTSVRVGIIMARWNADIIQGLYSGVNESLSACGVLPSNIFTTYVPGAYEIPITARFLAASKRFDVIICLGCLIKGETMHFEYIAQATANGIMQVSLESYVPCIFGVLTVLNKEQAIKRSTGSHNEGLSWGTSAVEMGLARMSALGMDGKQTKESSTTPFVNFNAEAVNKTADATKQKKPFGF